jgi:uncharacterized surface protein with fasciclin (FAS1) repeats
MKKLITAIAMTATLGLATSVHAGTLADFLLADGDMFDTDQTDFDIVTQALLVCSNTGSDFDLVAAASDPSASLTAFLPTDKAFRILVEDVYGVAIKDEAELFAAIAAELGCGTIEDVLAYHIAPMEILAADVLAKEEGDTVMTVLTGATFSLAFKGRGQIRLVDNEPALRDPILRDFDIMADNGVAHVLDRVLLPIAVIE